MLLTWGGGKIGYFVVVLFFIIGFKKNIVLILMRRGHYPSDSIIVSKGLVPQLCC